MVDRVKEPGLCATTNNKKSLHLIRIGKYAPKQNVNPITEINKGTKPPSFNHKIRTIQRWFTHAIAKTIASFKNHPNLSMIESWVRTDDLNEASGYSIYCPPCQLEMKATEEENSPTKATPPAIISPSKSILSSPTINICSNAYFLEDDSSDNCNEASDNNVRDGWMI